MNEILTALARAFLEIFFEYVLFGTGWLILRMFRPAGQIKSDGCLVPIVGVFFWVGLGLALWGVLKRL